MMNLQNELKKSLPKQLFMTKKFVEVCNDTDDSLLRQPIVVIKCDSIERAKFPHRCALESSAQNHKKPQIRLN
ncbi:MAG: hypothetical protein P4L91_15150 [Burkholderiaceae bacterium]|nr:hypothetical protein [Burkholderiaceae bacterium]